MADSPSLQPSVTGRPDAAPATFFHSFVDSPSLGQLVHIMPPKSLQRDTDMGIMNVFTAGIRGMACTGAPTHDLVNLDFCRRFKLDREPELRGIVTENAVSGFINTRTGALLLRVNGHGNDVDAAVESQGRKLTAAIDVLRNLGYEDRLIRLQAGDPAAMRVVKELGMMHRLETHLIRTPAEALQFIRDNLITMPETGQKYYYVRAQGTRLITPDTWISLASVAAEPELLMARIQEMKHLLSTSSFGAPGKNAAFLIVDRVTNYRKVWNTEKDELHAGLDQMITDLTPLVDRPKLFRTAARQRIATLHQLFRSSTHELFDTDAFQNPKWAMRMSNILQAASSAEMALELGAKFFGALHSLPGGRVMSDSRGERHLVFEAAAEPETRGLLEWAASNFSGLRYAYAYKISESLSNRTWLPQMQRYGASERDVWVLVIGTEQDQFVEQKIRFTAHPYSAKSWDRKEFIPGIDGPRPPGQQLEDFISVFMEAERFGLRHILSHCDAPISVLPLQRVKLLANGEERTFQYREFVDGTPLDAVKRLHMPLPFAMKIAELKGQLAFLTLLSQRPFFADGFQIIDRFSPSGMPEHLTIVDTFEAFSGDFGKRAQPFYRLAPMIAANIAGDLAGICSGTGEARVADNFSNEVLRAFIKSFRHTFRTFSTRESLDTEGVLLPSLMDAYYTEALGPNPEIPTRFDLRPIWNEIFSNSGRPSLSKSTLVASIATRSLELKEFYLKAMEGISSDSEREQLLGALVEVFSDHAGDLGHQSEVIQHIKRDRGFTGYPFSKRLTLLSAIRPATRIERLAAGSIEKVIKAARENMPDAFLGVLQDQYSELSITSAEADVLYRTVNDFGPTGEKYLIRPGQKRMSA